MTPSGANTAYAGVQSARGTAVTLAAIVCTRGGRTILDLDALDISHGERIAIVGPNGAGKSSLLRLLAGALTADRGYVAVLDEAPGAMPRARLRRWRCQIGQVHQGLHLVQRLSALDNVLIGALGRRTGWRTWARIHRHSDIVDAEAALRTVGLLAKANTRVDRLSGGERQKTAIARLLMQKPRLILADDPTAALDPQAAAEVCALLVKAADKATLISVVHNTALLPLLAERVIGLKQGRVVFDLPVAQVDDARLLMLYRTESDGSLAAAWENRRQPTETSLGHNSLR